MATKSSPKSGTKTKAKAATKSGVATALRKNAATRKNVATRDGRESASAAGAAGVVLGLALVTKNGRESATAATVECLLLPGRGKLILTGNLVGSARDAAQVAVSLARARAPRLGLDPALFLRTDIHFHVMDPLPPKGGPSIGLPLYVALVSALTKTPVDKTLAFTGELSLTGAVLPVEGIAEKTKAAVRAGVTRLYVPEGNKEELKRIPKSLGIDSVASVDAVNVSRWKSAPPLIRLKGKGLSASAMLIAERRDD